MVLLNKGHDVACLEHREPIPRCGARDTAVGSQRCEVEDLTRPRSAHPHESVEGRKVSHLEQLSDVSLDVRSHIVRQPVINSHITRKDRRIATGEQIRLEVVGEQTGRLQLRGTQRQQF